jgi:hypothetical protein
MLADGAMSPSIWIASSSILESTAALLTSSIGVIYLLLCRPCSCCHLCISRQSQDQSLAELRTTFYTATTSAVLLVSLHQRHIVHHACMQELIASIVGIHSDLRAKVPTHVLNQSACKVPMHADLRPHVDDHT